MNVLDLLPRELNRINRDFRVCLLSQGGRYSHAPSGLSIIGRIATYLHAEEQVLYPALIAVAFNVRPSTLKCQCRLKSRLADAQDRLQRGDARADTAMRKLAKEMLGYARRHTLELLPSMRSLLEGRELRVLGGEMLLALAERRLNCLEPAPEPGLRAWAHTSGQSDYRALPLLCDVIEMQDLAWLKLGAPTMSKLESVVWNA